MTHSRNYRTRDLSLRIAGALTLGAGALAMRWLFHSVNPHLYHGPAMLPFVAAAIGFLCLSTGTTMVAWGAHLFDQITLSERWTRRGENRDAAR